MTDPILPLDEVRKKKRLDLYALMAQLWEIPIQKSLILGGKKVVDAVWKNLEGNREEKRVWTLDDQKKEMNTRVQKKFLDTKVDKIR